MDMSATKAERKRARARGPTFLDNVCLHLAASLLGPSVVIEHLRSLFSSSTEANGKADEGQQEVLAKETQLYWRSHLLTDLNVLQCSTSPLVSTDAQSRVVYIDCAISFLPPSTATTTSEASNNPNSSIDDKSSSNTTVEPNAAAAVSQPRIRAKFGALVRSWNCITVHPQSGVIDRSCSPDGGTYVQQSHYVTKRGLREYGNGISIDLDSMESRPTARLIGTALRGDGLCAEVIADAANGTAASCYGDGTAMGEKGAKKKVVVMLEHSTLGERGCFAIDGGGSDSDGRIGELAMKMILANLQAATIAPSNDTATPTTATQGMIAFDPAMENELRKVFEDWWDRASGGDVATMGRAEANTAAAASLLNNDRLPSGDVTAHVSDGLEAKTIASIGIGEEGSAPPPTKTNNYIDRSTEEKPRGSASSCVEGHTDQRPTGPAKENQEEDISALTKQKSSVATVESPQQQQKKRKAPGPILVRAGGGVGGGRKKKKKGRITIGKA
mmetsp:Transcript_8435/g.19029  ORF Transcript_8435/g.19029 Transcript_8435/m.19029 type:complete len:501 (-) Transcript_8435:409-1911(-)